MLKCILLTFDHLLSHDPNRFTRSAGLEGCRNLARDYVLGKISDDVGRMELAEYSLGLQYEPEYRGRYEQILAKTKLESRPFSHQLIVSGNPDTATLDGVFIAFGEEPNPTQRLAHQRSDRSRRQDNRTGDAVAPDSQCIEGVCRERRIHIGCCRNF